MFLRQTRLQWILCPLEIFQFSKSFEIHIILPSLTAHIYVIPSFNKISFSICTYEKSLICKALTFWAEKRGKCLLKGCTHCVCINEMCFVYTPYCSHLFKHLFIICVCNVCVQVYNLVLMLDLFFCILWLNISITNVTRYMFVSP